MAFGWASVNSDDRSCKVESKDHPFTGRCGGMVDIFSRRARWEVRTVLFCETEKERERDTYTQSNDGMYLASHKSPFLTRHEIFLLVRGRARERRNDMTRRDFWEHTFCKVRETTFLHSTQPLAPILSPQLLFCLLPRSQTLSVFLVADRPFFTHSPIPVPKAPFQPTPEMVGNRLSEHSIVTRVDVSARVLLQEPPTQHVRNRAVGWQLPRTFRNKPFPW